MREHVDRGGAGTYVVYDRLWRERCLNGESNLAGISPLGPCRRLLDGIQGAFGEPETRAPMRRCHMSDEAPEPHHQLPEAPPPLKPPPPPLKPPPPLEPPPRPPNPPPNPPPIPPPKPPQPPPPAVQPREDPSSIANKNPSTPAPRPRGSPWLKTHAITPARPPLPSH